MIAEDEMYMSRCIQLAKNGVAHTSPNPMVGAVIVNKGNIIGEGYHVCYGKCHAEVNAINSVKDERLLKNSTIYVSLEPCSHYGKTPPCADLIISKQIPRVVVGCLDPFPEVSGRGIKKLQAAGVDVKLGVLENECKELIKKFITYQILKRPYIILKWAESADGYIDINREEGGPITLSTSLTSMIVHKRRTEIDGIMVGTRTALLDNPHLNIRNWSGENPIRIIIDRELTLPATLNLFDNTIKTLVFTSVYRKNTESTEYIRIDYDSDIILQVLDVLYQKKVQSVMIEGGSILLESFIKSSLWNETYIEKSPLLLHGGIKSPVIEKSSFYEEEIFFGRRIMHYKK